MLHSRRNKISDDAWVNPSPKNTGFKMNEDSFISQWINFDYVSVLLILILNLFFCSFYDSNEYSEFLIVLTIYIFHHLRKFDDEIFTNMTKWTRFGIDIGCIVFYIILCNPININGNINILIILFFIFLLFIILFITFMNDPSLHLNKRDIFRNRTSLNGMDRFLKFFTRFIPLCFFNAFFTLPLLLYSPNAYFTMRWFVFFVMIYYWTDEFIKIVGDFAYMIRYIYIVLILSLNLVFLLVEGTQSTYEFTMSITIIISIACGWLVSVVLLFAMNLFPHEIWPHISS
eukprot:423956_1